MSNVQISQQLFQTLLLFSLAQAQGFNNCQQVFCYRQLAKDRRLLRQTTKLRSEQRRHGHGGQLRLVEKDLSLIRRRQTDHHIKTGGFSGTIWSKQSHYLAGTDLQIDPGNNLAADIGFAQTDGLQGSFHCDSGFFSGRITARTRPVSVLRTRLRFWPINRVISSPAIRFSP